MTDRRDTRNALNGEVLNVQLRHTAALAYDPAARAVVLIGARKAFPLGGDLADFARAPSVGRATRPRTAAP